jgi:hypothetical protein
MSRFYRAALIVTIGLVLGPPAIMAQTYWQNETSSGITDDIFSVTFGSGVFAATTAQGNVLRSLDGMNWSSIGASPGTSLNGIAYGNGSWIVVGTNGAILVSADLSTWFRSNSGTTNKLNAVVYYPGTVPPLTGLFIAVGDGGTILSSKDGTTWVAIPSGVTNSLTGIAPFFEDVVVSGQGCIVLNDVQVGGTPTVIETGASSGLNAIILAPTNAARSVTSYVAVGGNGLIVDCPLTIYGMATLPPTDWVTASVPTTASLWGITFGNASFVATGDNGTILVSSDGTNWTQQFPGSSYQNMSTATLLAAAFSPSLQRFVGVGKGGAILVSNAPQSVLGNVSTRGTVSSTQTLIGGFVVEGTGLQYVLVRADGPTLGIFGVPNPLPDPVLTVYDSNQNVIFQNAGWSTQTESASVSAADLAVGAFALPSGSKDSAMLLTLNPGAYTAVITSAGGNSGTALFEAYVY